MGSRATRGALLVALVAVALGTSPGCSSRAISPREPYPHRITSNDLLPPPGRPGDVYLGVGNKDPKDSIEMAVFVDGLAVFRGTCGPWREPYDQSDHQITIHLPLGVHRVRVEAGGATAERTLEMESTAETLWQVLREEDGSITIEKIGYC